MEKKYQIFISSTYVDLSDVRKKVADTILSMYQFPVGMELFSADDDEQWEVIKQTIDTSDYYIIIIGHRYGSETPEGISYTEKEYDYSKSKNIPVLAFIRDRDVAVTPLERESDPKKNKKLDDFIKKAKSNKMCDFWSTPDDLATKVSVALHKIFIKKPRSGWIKAENVKFDEISQEIVKLSQENRELRLENENLKSKIISKKPIIELTVNEGKDIHIQYNCGYDFWGEDIKLLDFHDDVPEELYKYVTPKDIENYNATLPSKEIIEDYRGKMILYNKIRETGIDFVLKISNNGNVKANHVILEIEFPDELKLVSEKDINGLKKPEIDLPENPISNAMEKNNDLFIMGYSMKNFLKSIPMLENKYLLDQFRNSPMPLISKTSPLFSYVEENLLIIKIPSILHTRGFELDKKYKIIPLKPGIFELKASIICEEYEDKHTFTIPLIVES